MEWRVIDVREVFYEAVPASYCPTCRQRVRAEAEDRRRAEELQERMSLSEELASLDDWPASLTRPGDDRQ